MDKDKSVIDKLKSQIDTDKFINDIYPVMCPGHQYKPPIFPKVHRIVVLGDIHGDYNLAIDMLKICKLIKIHNDVVLWQGEGTYVVQVGDQIDRCRPHWNMLCSQEKTTPNDENNDIKILKLFTDLHSQAEKVGGAVISLLGNHEIMNSMGSVDYVSYRGMTEFETDIPVSYKEGKERRIKAFKPGNKYGNFLGCSRYPTVVIGSNLFVHAGIIDALIDEIGLTKRDDDLITINIAIRMWLLGLLKKKYIKKFIANSHTSMFWTRILGNIPPNVNISNPVCMKHIDNVIKLFSVGSIFIGHTPQSFTYNENINSTCSNKVWRVDNGSSAAFDVFVDANNHNLKHNRRPQVVEIIGDAIFNVCDMTGCKKA